MTPMLKASIDGWALKHNLAKVREAAKNKKILAMIKANGYGHGIVNVANALKEADAFGVARLDEAIALRAAGISNRIVLMGGIFHANAKEELAEALRLKLELVIHHEEQIVAIKQFSDIGDTGTGTDSFRIWIKINTGMNRLGFQEPAFLEAWRSLSQLSSVQIEGFMTHFARAEEVDNQETALQIERFFNLVQDLPGAKCLANSAGILAWPASHGDWVRPGIMLYGASPFLDRAGIEEGLKPVMTLQSRLMAVHSLKQGDAVGYGGIFVCPKAARIGVVAIGYGDGYPRTAPNGTPVVVNGKTVPLVGRVSMDMLTVDLSTQPESKVGDPVQLWGPLLPVEAVARAIGTSGYELLTGLTSRVPFEVEGLP